MKPTPQTLAPEERCILAHQVYQATASRTESFFLEDNIGGDLAYLMGAILDPSGEGKVDWSPEHGGPVPALLEVLRPAFSPDHLLWQFIIL